MGSDSLDVVEKFWAPFTHGAAPTGVAAAEWKNTFAEDAIWEMPYAPAPLPKAIEGRALIGHFADWLFSVAPDLRAVELSIQPMGDPSLVLVEMQMASTLAINGRSYSNTYVSVMRVVDNKIALFREYFNPLVVLDAFSTDEIEAGLQQVTAAAAATA